MQDTTYEVTCTFTSSQLKLMFVMIMSCVVMVIIHYENTFELIMDEKTFGVRWMDASFDADTYNNIGSTYNNNIGLEQQVIKLEPPPDIQLPPGHKWHVMNERNYRFLSREPLKKRPRNLVFVHVGKTGGSTLFWLLKPKCMGIKKNCPYYKSNLDLLEVTEISKKVRRYFHHKPVDISKPMTTFIVTVRDPIDRFASWFFFSHPENNGHYRKREREYDAFWKRFRSWDDLATVGLDGIQDIMNIPDALVRNQTLERLMNNNNNNNATNNNPNDTAKLTALGLGNPSEIDHMAWNLQFYVRELLETEEYHRTKEIFVIRTEYLWDDWQNINTLLRGGLVFEAPKDDHLIQNVTKATLPIHDRTVSKRGLWNLCCAMKEEIIIYQKLLQRAINIDDILLRESLGQLFGKCNVQHIDGLCNINTLILDEEG